MIGHLWSVNYDDPILPKISILFITPCFLILTDVITWVAGVYNDLR